MFVDRLTVACGFLVVTTGLVLDGQPQPSFQTFFRDLERPQASLAKPAEDRCIALARQVATAPVDDVAAALPSMIAAVGLRDEEARGCAAVALLTAGQRADSPTLVGGHLGEIAALLNAADPELQRWAVLILGGAATRDAEGGHRLTAPLLPFLTGADRDPQAQADAVFYLMRGGGQLAPDALQAVAALARRQSGVIRAQILEALGVPGLQDRNLRGIVVSSLGDPDADVQVAAIGALSRIGQEAVAEAEPALRRLAGQPAERLDVQLAASYALLRIGRPVR